MILNNTDLSTNFIIKPVHEHFEVYNNNNTFLFSADTEQEVQHDIEEFQNSYNSNNINITQ